MPEPKLAEVGCVRGFFAKPCVAIVKLTAPLRVGDALYIKGHTTDFQQVVESMQIERTPLQEARSGQTIGLQVRERCRRHDLVYRLVAR